MLRFFTHFLALHFAGSNKSLSCDFPCFSFQARLPLLFRGFTRNGWPQIDFPFLPFRTRALGGRGTRLPHNLKERMREFAPHYIE
jgi:hypothetical protein